MDNEDGHAVGYRNGHGSSAAEREMTIRFSTSKPALPPGAVRDDAVTMDLTCGR